MSIERELLNKAIEMIKIVPMMASIGNVPPDFASELILEIQELLAQPEQEPFMFKDRELTGSLIVHDAMYKKGYTQAALDLNDTVSKLRNLRDIQGTKSTYDYDEYMRGLFNGLELSLSLFEDRAPDYKEYIKTLEQEPSDTEIITAYQMLVRRKLGLPEKNEVLQLGEPEFKVCENKIDGVCPLHNLQCQYPECEE